MAVTPQMVADGIAAVFTDRPVDCQPNSSALLTVARELFNDQKAWTDWGSGDAHGLQQVRSSCENGELGICGFLGYLMLLHQEMWHRWGEIESSMSHCFTAFWVAVNTGCIHEQIAVALAQQPSLNAAVLDTIAKMVHEKFICQLRARRNLAKKRDVPESIPHPIREIEKQVMYFQAGWIISDIKFAELRRTKYVDSLLVSACNALCMAKADAISSMPIETALTHQRDRGGLTYVKLGVLDLLIAFENTVRTEIDPRRLDRNSFIKACEKICASDSAYRDLLFDILWQQRSVDQELQVDLSVAQLLFDKMWAKYYHTRQKSLINQVKQILRVDAAPAMREDVRHTGKKQKSNVGITNKKLKSVLSAVSVGGVEIHAMFQLVIKTVGDKAFMGLTIGALHAACLGYGNTRGIGKKERYCETLGQLVTANECQLNVSHLRRSLDLSL